jgi:dTDP-4-amino-4,6-dideoxygalactose transaminase
MIPLMKPSPPPPESWVKYLEPSYNNHVFCNYGPVTSLFEEKLQKYLDSEFKPVTACNATLALEAALLTVDIRGKEVLVPTFTFAATAHSVERAGGIPVLVDSIESSWHLCLEDARQKVNKNTSVVVLVNPFGMTIDLRPYQEFARDHGIFLILDSAASFGAYYPNGKLYSNEIEVFSFHVTKTMGIGEGAAIFSPNQDFLNKLRRVCNFGFNDDALVDYPGTNAKMSDFQAAVGVAKIEELGKSLYTRQTHAGYYQMQFSLKSRKVLSQNNGSLESHTYPFYPIRYLGDTVYAKTILKERQIGYRQYYQPLHLHPYFSRYNTGNFQVADHLAKTVFCLPCYDDLTITEMDEVIQVFL